jgi:hypothetical protein
MRSLAYRSIAMGVCTALLGLGLMACDDDSGGGNKDMAVSNDMAMKVPADMTAAAASTAQVTVADVVGVPWIPYGTDGGVPFPNPANGTPGYAVHSLAGIADFPAKAGSSQMHSGSDLEGCTWNRYDLNSGNPATYPAPNENAGDVNITGYDTTKTAPLDLLTQTPGATDPNIHCTFNATTYHYDCYFGSDATHGLTRYLFVPDPNSGFNLDIMGATNTITETLTHNASSSFTNDLNVMIGSPLPSPPGVVSVKVGTTEVGSLAALDTQFNGSADITIDYSCDGTTTTKGAGCTSFPGSLTGFLVTTSLGKKWEPNNVSPNNDRFGTVQCVDADGPTATREFVLTQAMQQYILGSDSGQSVQIILVRLKVGLAGGGIPMSGSHTVYMTAGRGVFAYVDQ